MTTFDSWLDTHLPAFVRHRLQQAPELVRDYLVAPQPPTPRAEPGTVEEILWSVDDELLAADPQLERIPVGRRRELLLEARAEAVAAG